MTSDERFRRIYAAHFDALLAYAIRRVEQPEDAADVVAEAFVVVWRRRGDVPPDDEVRMWLYGVARRVLANHHRGRARRDRLGERLRQRLRAVVPTDPGSDVPHRLVLRAALARLSALDREVLMLTFWEGLEPREIATVLGLSAPTVRARLSRARRRLRELVGHDLGPPGHELGVRTGRTPEEGR
ncbi:RNA polymerase sigma factor [Cryptosporangium arvum]|uniref:RNA polymerase sigma factor n=1 Tax=Cryptosporangium arvum TaxID=80871 RepID=UPI0004AD50D5|nr:RNA polymerase sigma factor [Cryptosporangium arvum]